MPSTYAHYRFGLDVLDMLPQHLQNKINCGRAIYEIGLHGPDIFFYYHPFYTNAVNAIGYGLHEKPARGFFEDARKIICLSLNRIPAQSYIYGFLCHFALDRVCHPYIEQKIRESGVSHTEIEVEFDAALMRMDGYDPLVHQLTAHISPTADHAAVIQRFFPKATVRQVQKALRSMVFYNHLLVAPSSLKRHLIWAILKLSGNYKEMHGLLVNRKPNPKCNDSTRRLMDLYEEAIELAVNLITDYAENQYSCEPLSAAYDHTFGAQ